MGAFSIAVSGMVMASAMGPLMHVAVAEVLAAFAGVVFGVLLRRTLGRTDDGATASSPMRPQPESFPDEVGVRL